MKVLLVDDDPAALGYASALLRDDHELTTCGSGVEALAQLETGSFDVVLTDLRMPPPDGIEILRTARELDPPVPVILLTAVNDARPAVEAMRLGACDFLVKPACAKDIACAIERVCAGRPLPLEPTAESQFGLVGCSPPIQLVRRLIPAVARSQEAVLIIGETGTGKELLARAIHAQSQRKQRAFVAHNMAATPIDLAESIFLGHARGAFTGAASEHPGLFEQADTGTLFLDEVDSFPACLQAKLLRVLEGGRVERIGTSLSRSVDVRVIAASAVDLAPQVEAGTFRADLYYRLRQLEIVLPPLRERPGDIPTLVRHFIDELARESGSPPRIDPAAMDRLVSYPWPGNVRELRNVLRAAAVMAGAGAIRPEHFPRALRSQGSVPRAASSLRVLEMRHIREVLERVAGNQSQAARILGIDRGTLARKLAAEKSDSSRSE
ncbi:MAG TPA: sigma-54 dependent transcriptional regulator [Candidatus Eisenbacteria bacterium]|nr:sigma-54 dependent transcriptional regulator [Candidatus Eisenbacteria bacterium]